MRKLSLIIFFFLIASSFFSCKKNGGDSPQPLSPPNITSISPTSGGYATIVTINGSNFSSTSGNNTITINGVQTNVLSATTTILTVSVPEHSGTGQIVVTTANGSVNGPVFTYNTTEIYVAGIQQNSTGYSIAKYWKNGTSFNLTDGSRNAGAGDITLSGSDLYVAGFEDGATQTIAKYWKNGIAVNLSNGNYSTNANSIAISGTDVHVSGVETNATGKRVIKYWKNGISTDITNGTNNAYTVPNSIRVVGNDVYIAGYESNGTKSIAKYWRNGTPFNLTDGTKDAYAYSIFVAGNDVYVAGSENEGSGDIAKYWKNGIPTLLQTTPAIDSRGLSIFVKENDIYVAGNGYNLSTGVTVPKFWKNAINSPLAINGVMGQASFITVFNNDVYICGEEGSEAKYWKNGTATSLSDAPGGYVYPYSMYIR